MGGINVSSRMFQGVVLQMKDGIDRVVGVIDADGIVVACSELTSIGEHWSGAVAAINAADNGITRYEGKTFKLGRSVRLRRFCPGGGPGERGPVRHGGGGLQRSQDLL